METDLEEVTPQCYLHNANKTMGGTKSSSQIIFKYESIFIVSLLHITLCAACATSLDIDINRMHGNYQDLCNLGVSASVLNNY